MGGFNSPLILPAPLMVMLKFLMGEVESEIVHIFQKALLIVYWLNTTS